MILSTLFILIGFVLLIKGGDYLIRGAVAIAERAHLDALVIGLTVVAFGTSAPELLVSLQAALQGSSGLAIGNVVGSNIANIALILGVTATLAIVPVRKITLAVDMPFLLLSCLLMTGAALTGTIERWHGLLGLALLIGFVTWQIRHTRRAQGRSATEKAEVETASNVAVATTPEAPGMKLWVALLMVVLSCAALSYGADLLVRGASDVARTVGQHLGVPTATMERIIGLTIVAIGTSLPELFASVAAARKGETDMAIGNVIGSNIFNILCVVGASATITPIVGTASGFTLDYAAMILLTLLLWFFLYTDRRLSHTEGIVLLLFYVAFIGETVISG
jgi:cation:H+ antiporter